MPPNALHYKAFLRKNLAVSGEGQLRADTPLRPAPAVQLAPTHLAWCALLAPWGPLLSHPRCILSLSFMVHVDEAAPNPLDNRPSPAVPCSLVLSFPAAGVLPAPCAAAEFRSAGWCFSTF